MEGESAGKRMTIMFKLLIPAFAALLLATAAQAKKSDQTTLSVTVRYGDLDLASDAGAATLQARIAAAVKTVCPRPDLRVLGSRESWQRCRSEAMEGAIEQLAAARVSVPLVALAR